MEGVLAFLAAEILRGCKVVIFPEGGMIKDRRVRADDGELRIVSPSTGEERKHHTGAAAVALVLEIFKERIRSVSRQGENERLQRWADALRLESVEVLVARASRPTRIVPANITFHPIRADENILTRGANLLFRGLALNVKEELLIEGNILLRDTDMDIRLAEAVSPDIRWSWWERQLLAWSFSQIESLDHLFDINASPNKLIDRLASTLVHHNIRRLRDHCMIEMYRHTTVNMAHLASTMLYALLDEGRTEIGLPSFRQMLHSIIKQAQTMPDVALHRGLLDPEAYENIMTGGARDLERLIDSARVNDLIRIDDDTLHILPRMRELDPDAPVRLSHAVRVYANELAPIDKVCTIIKDAARNLPIPNRTEMADIILDDEIRAFEWSKRRFAKPRYAEINDAETATANAAPYLLRPESPHPTGVVLIHGFLSSPAELVDYGRKLAAAGHVVVGARLRGHGTSPHDLKSRHYGEWLHSVRQAIRIVSGHVDHFVLAGFSMGGAIALRIAAEEPCGLEGVISVAAPLRLRQKTLHLAPALHGVNQLSTWAASMEGVMPFIASDTAQPGINYQNIPVRSLIELRNVIREAYREARKVKVPALIIQGTHDPVVDPKSAELYRERLASRDSQLHWIDSDRHGLVLFDVGDTRRLMTDFIQSRRAAEPDEERIAGHPAALPVHAR